jgi:enamine deaminase RidA (YjgF/YER057c/UK114 family)
MSPYAALEQMQLKLPPAPSPAGNYLSAKTVGQLVFLAGVVSQNADGVITGTVGLDRDIDAGYTAAKQCALMQLAVLERHLGSLNYLKSIVSVTGFVNSIPDFADSPKVLNGASDLLVAIFGEAGKHVRAAVGVNSLPRQALVEVQMIVEIE